jgi:CHAT domain-containing protein
MHNLGSAYINRRAGDHADNTERAVRCYQSALEVRARASHPHDWASSHANHAAALLQRTQGDPDANLADAISHLEATLEVRTRESGPDRWAAIHHNLGQAFRRRTRVPDSPDLDRAAAHFRLALEVYNRDDFPAANLMTLLCLGDAYFDVGRWPEALDAYREAMAADRLLALATYTEHGRRRHAENTAAVYANAAYCLAQLGEYEAAFVTLDQGKTRALTEAVALAELDRKVPNGDRRERIQALRRQLVEYETELQSDTAEFGRRGLANLVRQTRAELASLVQEGRAGGDDLSPGPLAFDEVKATIPAEGALAAPLVTSRGTVVFVLPHGVDRLTDQHVVWLPDFTRNALDSLLRGTEESPGWLRAYRDSRGLAAGRWEAAVDDITARVWCELVQPVHERLAELDARSVIVLPHAGLQLLPLHAAWRDVDGRRCYFADDYEVWYIPSARALCQSQDRLAGRIGTAALVAGVSRYAGLPPIPNAAAEARAVAGVLGTEAILDGRVSAAAVKQNATGVAYLHLACHGCFAWGGDPARSALYLAEDEALTFLDVVAGLDLGSARLVTLSACDTGITDVTECPDEFLGLPAAFLRAGAAAVVSSLWLADDRGTALLMERFYRNHVKGGMPPPRALREAQVWLRTLTPEEVGRCAEDLHRHVGVRPAPAPGRVGLPFWHPVYWAGFSFVGAAGP